MITETYRRGMLMERDVPADLSPDHLRQQFKRVAGMTLSRYQMWQRLRGMVRQACEDFALGRRVKADAMIHAAGFHDTPHEARAIRRYFGMTASAAAAAGTCFVDCRAQGMGQR